MRTLALCLLLSTALLCVLPGTLRAGGDDDDRASRLERRIEMLIDLVAGLRAEVKALRERVAKLEAEPKVEFVPATLIEPATPIEPDPTVTWADVSGVYALDTEASIEAILESQLEDVEDEEVAAMIRQGIVDEIENVEIALRIEKNGTFFVRLNSAAEEDESTARGTWTRDESGKVGARQRLLFVTTHEDGEKEEDPTELVGTWEGGRLTLEEGDGASGGYVMIFDRK